MVNAIVMNIKQYSRFYKAQSSFNLIKMATYCLLTKQIRQLLNCRLRLMSKLIFEQSIILIIIISPMSKQQKSKNKDINKKSPNIQEETKNFVSKNVNSENQPIRAPSKKSEKIKQNNLSAEVNQKTIEKQQSILRQFPEPDQYNVLKMSGILDAYQHFLKLLCKHGLPTGRVFEYAAQEIQKYQRRKINKELKMRAELDIQKIKKSKPEPSPEKPFYPSPSPYLEH